MFTFLRLNDLKENIAVTDYFASKTVVDIFHLISCVTVDWSFSLLAVEDKVKDQLEAANPEPIIEEVVSNLFCLKGI